MKALKQLGFKLIVILCVIMTFGCFVASTPVSYASKVKSGDQEEFYYSGTTKGSYTVDKGFLEKLISALSAILDYLLGIFTMGTRIVFVGWGELMERVLTWMIEGATGEEINIDSVDPTGMNDSDDYITVEAIVFNHVPLFNINVFDYDNADEDRNSLGQDVTVDRRGNEIPEDKRQNTEIADDSLINVLKRTIAGWYYTFRLIALMVMLVLLVYIGVKLAIASATKEKALYKRVLTDWVVGLILVFFMHYIILAMITFNELLVDQISKLQLGYGSMEVYEYGLKERATNGVTDADMEVSIYDEVRTRAYDARLSVGTPGMVMYLFLIYYAWKFSFLYLKRYLVVAVLIMMSPLVAVMYAYNKVKTGKTIVFTNWFKELLFMIMLQSIHALMYVIFFEQALAISLNSIGGMIFSFVMLHFMTEAEEIFRKIFGIKGNLTSDVAGSKLSDLKSAAANLTMGAAGAKAAVATTKLAGRVVTKPGRLAAGAVFGKAMEGRARKLDQENAKLKAKNKDTEDNLSKEETENISSTNKLKLGAVAKSIGANDYSQLSKEEKASLKKLREAIPMTNSDGEELSEEEYMKNFMANKDKFAEGYDEEDKHKYRKYISKKWKEIYDPYQYVTKDENGNYKRNKNVREHEDWGPIARVFSKKKDGATATYFKYVNTDYLYEFNDKEKKFIKETASGIGSVMTGFFGILVGMPLAIAEPKIGFALLAKGISDTHKTRKILFGDRTENKNIRGYELDVQGKWHFAGYQGDSVKTMGKGALAMAREQAQDIEDARVEHDRGVVRRARKHKRLMQNVNGGSILPDQLAIAGTTAVSARLATIGAFSATPLVAGVAGVAAGSVFAGRIVKKKSLQSARYMNFLQVVREHEQKNLDEEIDSLDGLLDYYAGKYYETEQQIYDINVAQKEVVFTAAYETAVKAEIEKVQNLSDEELIRDSGYEEPLETTTDENGEKHLTKAAEDTIIDKAIIENAQKSGIINLEEYDVEDSARLTQVKTVVKDMLVQKGLMDKDAKIEEVISGIDERIKTQKVKLEKDKPTAVESKMVDDSIVEVMQEKGISDPSKVSEKDVAERFESKYRKMAETPSKQSTDVIATMQQKEGGAEVQTSVDAKVQATMDRVKKTTIQARKSSISLTAKEAKKNLNDQSREALKVSLAKKKVKELDEMMLSHQDEIESGGVPPMQPAFEEVSFGGESVETQAAVSRKQTDDVLKMLELQTQIHKDRTRLEEVSKYSNKTGKARARAYKAQLIAEDGTVRANPARDGSRRANDNIDGNRRVDSSRDGSRRVEASSRTMEVPKESREALIDIINKVNSQIII